MKPHSLQTISIGLPKTPAQKKAELGWAGRFPQYPWPKGTVLPETKVQACPRVRVADLPEGFIPPRYYQKNLEQNQLIASCCRHPENHDVEAFKSHPEEPAPDIYIFHCDKCGRKHTRFMVGMTEKESRPVWDAS